MVAVAWRLPINLPAPDSAAFVGMHYLYPMIAITLFGVFSAAGGLSRGGRHGASPPLLVPVACYALILLLHFNVKLWLPHLRTVTYDDLFWSIDTQLHGVVQACMTIREWLAPVVPYEANAYMVVYIGAFYAGLVGQAKMAPGHVRELVVACMLMQIFGTIGYLAFPAIGPFIHEVGVNPLVTKQQIGMWEFCRQSVESGPGWVRLHGSEAFTAGLAAMPSLHVSGMVLFFLNACRRKPVLAPVFGVLMVYIMIASVANRWHYLADLPAGVLTAMLSLWLAPRLLARPGAASDRLSIPGREAHGPPLPAT